MTDAVKLTIKGCGKVSFSSANIHDPRKLTMDALNLYDPTLGESLFQQFQVQSAIFKKGSGGSDNGRSRLAPVEMAEPLSKWLSHYHRGMFTNG